MPATRQQAIENALISSTYPVGMCARWTREQFGIGALGDFDGDGDADAVDMWKAARSKHADDPHPPAGVPVFWSGGSKGHGHAAISLPGGRIRSIDRPQFGLVGTVPLADIEQSWGLTYLGWSDDLYGNEIVDENAADKRRAEVRPDLNEGMATTKDVQAEVKGRPRMEFWAKKARQAYRKMRQINRGE